MKRETGGVQHQHHVNIRREGGDENKLSEAEIFSAFSGAREGEPLFKQRNICSDE